jgi:hypothetical protein
MALHIPGGSDPHHQLNFNHLDPLTINLLRLTRSLYLLRSILRNKTPPTIPLIRRLKRSLVAVVQLFSLIHPLREDLLKQQIVQMV